ncbi:MAG: hypothetical protein GYB67_02300 [Chloroflexi bacterium]|nr:hypothetical protein [Chloroflexota bacterium]
MNAVEAAILRTVLYADVFDFPMTCREIHHFLIADHPISLAAVAQTLAASQPLRARLQQIDGYVVRAGRADLLAQRRQREQASAHLWPQALIYGVWLARLPFVRMVALTGALAMHNAADTHDDLDYVIVTAAHRVWLARACAVLLVRVARLRGVIICPNYVLAEDALAQDCQDLYIAHEVAQMVPLYGHDRYRALRQCNGWVDAHLPNATTTFYPEHDHAPRRGWALIKRGLEALLGGRLGGYLEIWEYRRKRRRFSAALAKPDHRARIDARSVKGHFDDHGQRVLRGYHARLQDYHMSDAPLTASGD